jgi:outer membrane immunogenic protein
MKKLFLAAAILGTLGAGSALAADMPLKAPVYKAPPPVYNWTGFYFDLGGGSGMWNADTQIFTAAGLNSNTVTMTQGGRGYFGTVSVGFDVQASEHIVWGLLADFDFGDMRGTFGDESGFDVGTMRLRSAWAAGGRIGWLVAPNILSYVDGGYTQARFSSVNYVCDASTAFCLAINGVGSGAPTGDVTPGTTRDGWFIGSGVEFSMSSILPGLFSRTEYRFASYNGTNLPKTNAGVLLDFIAFRPTVQTVRTEFVYKFNWGGPVVAKY